MDPILVAILAAAGALVLGFLLGVWAAGRAIVPLYTDRIRFLERELRVRGVEVQPSVQPMLKPAEE